VAKLIDEAEITVRIRQEDLNVAKEAVALAQQELQKYKKTNHLTLDTNNWLPPSKHSVEGLATWYAVFFMFGCLVVWFFVCLFVWFGLVWFVGFICLFVFLCLFVFVCLFVLLCLFVFLCSFVFTVMYFPQCAFVLRSHILVPVAWC
jgi:hypothetical protein